MKTNQILMLTLIEKEVDSNEVLSKLETSRKSRSYFIPVYLINKMDDFCSRHRITRSQFIIFSILKSFDFFENNL